MPGPALTLLVPCFDEGERIDRLVEAVLAWVAGHPEIDAEILCVDDGSTDDTAQRLVMASARLPALEILRLDANGGKGAALRAGVAAARGAAVLFLDADLAVDLAHVAPALAQLHDGADVVIGCRNVPGAVIRRGQRAPRRWLGRGYRKLACWWLGLRVSDVTCGFKAFRGDVARRLFARARAARWGFDAEILHLARREHCEIREMPVQWYDGEASSVRLGRDVWGSLVELVAARWRHRGARAPGIVAAPPTAPRLPAGSAQER